MRHRVTRIEHADGRATAVWTEDAEGRRHRHACEAVISSMPLGSLVESMDPPAPADVRAAAAGLRHRDFLTIALVVGEEHAFPDNWIYVHSAEVKLGRIQNFGSWSPHMVKEGHTCLGLEYFVNRGDEYWRMADDDLIELGKRELETIGLVPASAVEAGYVVRMPGAYPVYDADLRRQRRRAPGLAGAAHAQRACRWAATACTATTTRTTRCSPPCWRRRTSSTDADHDLWSVNVEEDYHEEISSSSSTSSASRAHAPGSGTGRAAPITS